MSYPICAVAIAISMAWLAVPAHAVTCANGVYRAGCAGPNGAVVGRKPYAAQPYYGQRYYGQRYYHGPSGTVTCANGVYRAGCAGPNGAGVVRKPY